MGNDINSNSDSYSINYTTDSDISYKSENYKKKYMHLIMILTLMMK